MKILKSSITTITTITEKNNNSDIDKINHSLWNGLKVAKRTAAIMIGNGLITFGIVYALGTGAEAAFVDDCPTDSKSLASTCRPYSKLDFTNRTVIIVAACFGIITSIATGVCSIFNKNINQDTERQDTQNLPIKNTKLQLQDV